MDSITDLLCSDPEEALNQMLGAYTGVVYRAVRVVLGRQTKEEIEECVSDAFLAVYRRRNELDFSKGSLKAYLCATAHDHNAFSNSKYYHRNIERIHIESTGHILNSKVAEFTLN